MWAITDAGHAKLLEIASRENEITADVIDRVERRREAVAAKRGMRMDGTDGVVMRDDVAVIEVVGPIFRYANLFTAISGATAVETLATDFSVAMDDPAISGVIFTFDSPGGQVSGINELATMIASRSSEKPVMAYIGTMAASAAYWLAAAATEIVIEATAEAGSIGIVIAQHTGKTSDVVQKVSSQSPKKRLDPTSESGQAELQRSADTLAQVFIDFVKAHRPEGVNLLDGGMAIGADAVTAKLADRLGSLEGLIAEISAQDQRPQAQLQGFNQNLALNGDWRITQ
jgi:ClpP class serine protease